MKKPEKNDGIFTIKGEAAVREYLQLAPEMVLEVLATKELQPEVQKWLQNKKPLKVWQKPAGDAPENGRQASIGARIKVSEIPFSSWLAVQDRDKLPRVLLALDQVQDPRNLGAIVRSAAFFGVPAVFVGERRQALLSDAVVNTAQGGFARCQVVSSPNVKLALRELKELGFWLLGADMEGRPFSERQNFFDHVVLVLGAEGSGLSETVRRHCDELISIPAQGLKTVESLNVSVAAGILLHGFVTAQISTT